MLIDQLKKYFCKICGYCFVEWWVKLNNISRSIFWFLSVFVVVVVVTENLLFLRASNSFSWMVFGICFMTFGG